MSTPEEKAKELIDKFEMIDDCDDHHYQQGYVCSHQARKCALIAVNEIIEALESFGYTGAMYDDFETGKKVVTDEKLPCDYWREVLVKLENL